MSFGRRGPSPRRAAEAYLELEAFGAIDERDFAFLRNVGYASFSLAVAITLPPDDELYVVARLSGRAAAVPAELSDSGIATVKNVKIVALAVDTLEVQTA